MLSTLSPDHKAARPSLPPEDMLARQILPSSGTMIGLCTTLIGFVKISEARIGPSRVDELSGLVALIFLVSSVSAYLAIRYHRRARFSQCCEQVADIAFLVGLACLTLVSLLFAYELI